jgi:hypothetical protein
MLLENNIFAMLFGPPSVGLFVQKWRENLNVLFSK